MAMKLAKIVTELAIVILLAVVISPTDALARTLVLVSSGPVNYKPLTQFESRKIFFGYSVTRAGKKLSAIRNITDDQAYQVFLQKLVCLSAKNYERRLLSKTFITGTPSVLSEDSLPGLRAALLNDDTKISFMWLNDVQSLQDIKVIQTIWQGNMP